MSNISKSIKKIYGLTEKKHEEFIKKYSLQDVKIDVNSIKKWDKVPEKVLHAFHNEFGSDFNLLHEYFQRNLFMKELEDMVVEVKTMSSQITLDELITMLIEADSTNNLNETAMYENIILEKGKTSISVDEVIDILDLNYYNDIRINAVCYKMFNQDMSDQYMIPLEEMLNFSTMIAQLTDNVLDIKQGTIMVIVNSDSTLENHIILDFGFVIDEQEQCVLSATEAYLCLESPSIIAQQFTLVVRADSTINTVEVADGLDKVKEVPLEYMGAWTFIKNQFAGMDSEITSNIDATDFNNDLELKVISEATGYKTTEPFLCLGADEEGDFQGDDM